MIRFGPAGLGGVKEAVANLEHYNNLGLKACEIAFTYGIYIKESQKKEIEQIRKASEKFDIKLSIHAPYYINLNSSDKRKAEQSRKRILDCCKIGEMLGAYAVVFHPGYYGKGEKGKEETFENIRKPVREMVEEARKQGWRIKLAPETMGKVNVFGSLDEILEIVKKTGCFFCVDFAHIKARSNGKLSYKEIYDKIKHFEKLHVHFSGIEFGEKGERRHLVTSDKEIRELISVLPKNKDIVVINESPEPVRDSVKASRL